jgi:hypothetical protein
MQLQHVPDIEILDCIAVASGEIKLILRNPAFSLRYLDFDVPSLKKGTLHG